MNGFLSERDRRDKIIMCKNCGHELKDVLQSIKDDPLTFCEQCGEHSLSRVIFGGRAAFVENVSTIGQLADKNTKKIP